MADRPGDRVIWILPSWRALLDDGQVRLVCFPHCSNVVAEINPVAEICAMAHGRGRPDRGGRRELCARTGCRTWPALGADVYLFSAYKTYGPHQGIMVIRRGLRRGAAGAGAFLQRGHALQALHARGAGSCADRGLCGDGGLRRCASCRATSRPEADPAARNRAVHDLMRAQEVAVVAAAAGLSGGAQRPAADRAARGGASARRRWRWSWTAPAEPVAVALAKHGITAGRGDFYAVRPLQRDGGRPEPGRAADEPRALHQRRGRGAADRGAGPVL